MSDLSPHAVDQPIPMVCTIDDVCRILQVSESQFFNLRRTGRFPIPEIQPRLDKRPRFRGADVRSFITGGQPQPRTFFRKARGL